MKKRFFAEALVFFAALIGASLVNLLTCSLAVKIVNLFIVVEYFEAAIVSSIMSFITICGVIAALGYYDGFKRAEFFVGRSIGEVALAGAMQLVLSIPLMFYPFIAGGTRYLAGLIDMGSNFNSADRIEDIYLWTYLGAFAIYLALEIGTCALFGIIGKKRRLKQRRELTEQK